MKKIIALVLAALMIFTLVAPASAAAEPEITEEGIQTTIVTIKEKVNVFAAFFAKVKDFIHKFVGTITQVVDSKCPFCDGTHLPGAPDVNVEILSEKQTVNVDGKDYTLDIAYNFTPGEITKLAEQYKYWHADFVVTTSKDIKNVLLAGQYAAYGNGAYVGKFIDLSASNSVRLIQEYSPMFSTDGEEVFVNCDELINIVKSFNCGIYNGDASNVGATITVELRLYETYEPTPENNTHNDETGRWVTVATVPCTIMAA